MAIAVLLIYFFQFYIGCATFLIFLKIIKLVAHCVARITTIHPSVPRMSLFTRPLYAMPRNELRRNLIVCLRQGKDLRRPRSRGDNRRGQLLAMQSINLRPPEADARLVFGHGKPIWSKAHSIAPQSAS